MAKVLALVRRKVRPSGTRMCALFQYTIIFIAKSVEIKHMLTRRRAPFPFRYELRPHVDQCHVPSQFCVLLMLSQYL